MRPVLLGFAACFAFHPALADPLMRASATAASGALRRSEKTADPGDPQQPSVLSGILLAVVGGSLSASGANVLAWATFQNRLGRQWTQRQNMFFSLACIVLNLAGIGLFGLSCSLGGAVSTVMPMQTGANLLTNMFWQMFLGIKHFDKPMRLGTLVLVCAVGQLAELGPAAPSHPDVLKLLTQPQAMAWMFSMVAATLVSLGLCHLTYKEPMDSIAKLCSYTMVVSLTTVIGSSLLKCLSLLSGVALAVAIAVLFVDGILVMGFTVLANAHCDVSLFIPAQLSSQLVINMVTGLLVWQDHLYIDKFIAYLLVYALCVFGVYLVSPDMDVVAHLAQKSWLRQTRLSAGLAPTPLGGAVLRLLAAWRRLDGQRQVADPRTAGACLLAMREILERASLVGVLKPKELIALVMNLLREHGPGPSCGVVQWVENQTELFQLYVRHDPEFQTAFRKTLSEAELQKVLIWQHEEELTGSKESLRPLRALELPDALSSSDMFVPLPSAAR